MNKYISALIASLILVSGSVNAQKLTILHTNDTHSQIDPTSKNLGGIARRKVIIDSVRAAEPNVILVDAGDAVQGTLYFSLFGGEVERDLMNALNYDMQILGNHEFDNGMEALAKIYKGLNAEKLTSNYQLDNTPLRGLFKPYTIKTISDKKIGFIAINLLPTGMISDKNTIGLEYKNGLDAANAYAWILKNMEGVDKVIALTHIGYENQPVLSDVDLAKGSRNIDVIIGGHSHTTINPNDANSKSWRIANADGDTVLVAQTGKSGLNIGQIDIDLNSGKTTSKLIAVDSRLDSRIDPAFERKIAPYRAKVDSVMKVPVGRASAELKQGEPALENFAADVVFTLGANLLGHKPDLAIINKGGLRTSIAKDTITKGGIMQVMPFDNYVTVLEIKGSDLLDALNVMAARGGDGVSANVNATISNGKVTKVTISGKPIDPEMTYTLSTINYLADGGDYMTPLKNGKRIAESNRVLYDDFIDQFLNGSLKGKAVKPDNRPRMSKQ